MTTVPLFPFPPVPVYGAPALRDPNKSNSRLGRRLALVLQAPTENTESSISRLSSKAETQVFPRQVNELFSQTANPNPDDSIRLIYKEVTQVVPSKVSELLSQASKPNPDPRSTVFQPTEFSLAVNSVLSRLEKKPNAYFIGQLSNDSHLNWVVNTTFSLLFIDEDSQSGDSLELYGIREILDHESQDLSSEDKNIFCSMFLIKLKNEMNRSSLIMAALRKELNQELWFVILREFHHFSTSINPAVAASVAEIMDSFSSVQEVSPSFIKKIQAEINRSSK